MCITHEAGAGLGVQSVGLQVRRRNRIRWDEFIVFLTPDPKLTVLECEFKQRNQAIIRKLRSNRASDHGWPPVSAHREVLLRLCHANFILSTLCLDRQNVLPAATIDANIDLINFYLPNTRC